MAENTQIQLLKRLLDIPSENTDEDDRVSFVIDYAEYAVKNYCRIDEIPAELAGVVIMVARDLFSSEGISGLKSIKEGDVRFEFGENAFGEDKILNTYHCQLEIFRKPGW